MKKCNTHTRCKKVNLKYGELIPKEVGDVPQEILDVDLIGSICSTSLKYIQGACNI